MGGAGLSFSRIVNDLEAELKSVEKKKDTLLSLLHSGRISQNTFDLMEKRTNRLTLLITDLKGTMEEEESFWMSNCSEETKILELLLIEFKIRHLLGEIEEEEWRQKSEIINFGLNFLKDEKALTDEGISKPVPPIQLADENIFREEDKTDLEKENKREFSEILPENGKNLKTRRTVKNRYSQNRHKRRIDKEPSTSEGSFTSEGHCMNPWKPKCRNTDIELSIYYDGKLTPICRECWEDISKKNIEWTGL